MWLVPLPPHSTITRNSIVPWPLQPLPPTSQWLRAAAVLSLLVLAFKSRASLLAAIKSYFFAVDSAVNLAVLRIITFAALASVFLVWSDHITPPLRLLDGYPDEILWYRHSILHLLGYPDAATYQWLTAIQLAACAAAILGFHSRLAAGVTLALSPYLLGMPGEYVSQNYTTFHLLWFAALLAVSPCDDALSIHSLIRRYRGQSTACGPSIVYGMPLRFAWLLMALMYFFPGFWKIYECGWEWVTSDNLRNLMYFFWKNAHTMPTIRPDVWPGVCNLAALWAVLFELFFIVALFNPISRIIFAVEGIAFLAGVYYFLFVKFFQIMYCNLIFFDWSRFGRFSLPGTRMKRDPGVHRVVDTSVPAPRTSVLAPLIVGVVLTAGMIVTGLGPSVSFPFACYPAFDGLLATTIPDIDLVVRHMDGSEYNAMRDHTLGGGGGNYRWFSLKLRLLIAEQRMSKARRIQVFKWFTKAWNLETLQPDDTLLFYREWMTTIPELDSSNPLSQELIMKLPASSLPRSNRHIVGDDP